MSLPTFKILGQNQNRQSHDFPARVLSGNAAATLSKPADSNLYDDQAVTANTNFEGMSQIKYERQSMDGSLFGENRGVFDANVRRKQLEVLQNPTLRTSLTTNIRNIMRNQDKGLLTTSTRLLNAQVKKAELKSELTKKEHSFSPEPSKVGNSKTAISTVDLLRRQKE